MKETYITAQEYTQAGRHSPWPCITHIYMLYLPCGLLGTFPVIPPNPGAPSGVNGFCCCCGPWLIPKFPSGFVGNPWRPAGLVGVVGVLIPAMPARGSICGKGMGKGREKIGRQGNSSGYNRVAS